MNTDGRPDCGHADGIDVYEHTNDYGLHRYLICRVCDRVEDMPSTWRWGRNLRYEQGVWS